MGHGEIESPRCHSFDFWAQWYHNGQFITLGLGGILIKCNKEKLVTRSSTEAELVCLSDGVGLASHCAEFLKHQGYNLTPELMQDNMSTIKLAEKGKSTSDRTRHVKIRYFFRQPIS